MKEVRRMFLNTTEDIHSTTSVASQYILDEVTIDARMYINGDEGRTLVFSYLRFIRKEEETLNYRESYKDRNKLCIEAATRLRDELTFFLDKIKVLEEISN